MKVLKWIITGVLTTLALALLVTIFVIVALSLGGLFSNEWARFGVAVLVLYVCLGGLAGVIAHKMHDS